MAGRQRGTPYYGQCAQPRNKLVTTHSLNLETGETVPTGESWEIGVDCGAPLFDRDLETLGRCKSCVRGWPHPGNFPVEGPMIAPPYKVGG